MPEPLEATLFFRRGMFRLLQHARFFIGRIAARHPIRDLFVQNPPIEEIVARLYGGVES